MAAWVLIKRLVAPRAGKFALPGGFINKGEGPREGCIRETFEETGLIVEIVRALDEVPVPGGNQFLCFYEVKVVGGTMKAGSDAGEVADHALDALPTDIAFPLHQKVIDSWLAEQNKNAPAPAQALAPSVRTDSEPGPGRAAACAEHSLIGLLTELPWWKDRNPAQGRGSSTIFGPIFS